jgi:hypothetical protein
LSLFDIVYEYDIAIFSPQSRQKSKVMTQLPARMGSGEICQSRGQSNVVFRVENV